MLCLPLCSGTVLASRSLSMTSSAIVSICVNVAGASNSAPNTCATVKKKRIPQLTVSNCKNNLP